MAHDPRHEMNRPCFPPGSMLRRVNSERVVALAGPRALLMQAAHPLAVSGLLAHSAALDEPYERLERTGEIMSTIAFGTRADAERVTAPVRRKHSRVRGRIAAPAGEFPAGTSYAADDPDLLLWVLYTLFDSVAIVYSSYVRTLRRRERARLWSDYRVVGELFGLHPSDMPATLAGVDAYGAEMLAGPTLHVTEWARRRAREIVLEPPIPLVLRPALQTANFVTVTLLPDRIREEYGFRSIAPIGVRRAMVAAGSEYVRRGVLPLLPSRLRLVPAARG